MTGMGFGLQAKLSRVIEAEVVTRSWCPATITPNEVRAWIRQPHPEPAQAGLISGMKVLRVDVVVDDDLAVYRRMCRDIGDVPDHPVSTIVRPVALAHFLIAQYALKVSAEWVATPAIAFH